MLQETVNNFKQSRLLTSNGSSGQTIPNIHSPIKFISINLAMSILKCTNFRSQGSLTETWPLMAPYVHFAARVDTETEKRIYKINSTIKKKRNKQNPCTNSALPTRTWTVNKSIERKITACQMRCVGKTVNKIRRDWFKKDNLRYMMWQVFDHIDKTMGKMVGQYAARSAKCKRL